MSTYVLRLRSRSDTNTIHHLRALLKTLGRRNWRCISAHEEKEFLEQPDVQPEERDMDKANLELLRNFAATARRSGFNVPFFRLDGNTGEYRRTGKSNTGPMNGQKPACDPVDAMTGYQKFENKIPIYQIGRVADGYQPPPREELGDLNEYEWENGKDPWVRIDLLPFWDVESREVLLFSAANQGSRSRP